MRLHAKAMGQIGLTWLTWPQSTTYRCREREEKQGPETRPHREKKVCPISRFFRNTQQTTCNKTMYNILEAQMLSSDMWSKTL